MDISKMDIKELKATAYDEGMKMEVSRQNLMILNQEIQKRTVKQNDNSNASPVGTSL